MAVMCDTGIQSLCSSKCSVTTKADFTVERDLVSYSLLKDLFHFMCVNVFPACMFVHLVCV